MKSFEFPFDRPPVRERRGISFYVKKSEAAFRSDPYEQYDPTVLRQTALQLADTRWAAPPHREIWDWCLARAPAAPDGYYLDLGCGVGRLVGELAQRRPAAQCIGLDTSYQLLRQANRYWCRGEPLSLDGSAQGFSPLELSGHHLDNVTFALADAADLPLAADCLACVTALFLFDRLADPAAALAEINRVVAPGGRFLLVLPYNFQRSAHWAELYPPARFRQWLTTHGWKIEESRTFAIVEPLDGHGNAVHWRAEGFVLRGS